MEASQEGNKPTAPASKRSTVSARPSRSTDRTWSRRGCDASDQGRTFVVAVTAPYCKQQEQSGDNSQRTPVPTPWRRLSRSWHVLGETGVNTKATSAASTTRSTRVGWRARPGKREPDAAGSEAGDGKRESARGPLEPPHFLLLLTWRAFGLARREERKGSANNEQHARPGRAPCPSMAPRQKRRRPTPKTRLGLQRAHQAPFDLVAARAPPAAAIASLRAYAPPPRSESLASLSSQ